MRDSAKNVAIEKGLSHAAHKSGSFLKLKSSGNIQKKARPTQPAPSSSNYKLDLDFSKDIWKPLIRDVLDMDQIAWGGYGVPG